MALNSFLEKATKSHLAQNTFWMFLGQGVRIPIQAVYFILIARALGSQGYGAFAGVTALVAILAPFASLGSGNILIKQVARDQSCFNIYWGKALLFTAFSGLILVCAVALLSKVLLPSTIPFVLILSISLADLLFSRILDISAQSFQAFQKLINTSQLMVLPNIMRLICLLLLLMFNRTPSPALWGYFYLLSIFISAIIGITVVNHTLGPPRFNISVLFSELKEGLYFSVSLSSQNIYNDIDKTMLAKLDTLESTGIYSAAYRIIDVSFTPIRSLLYAAYARFFQSGTSGISGSLAFASKLLPYAVSYGILASLILFIIAPILPHLLGSGYLNTVYALRWLSLLPLLKAIHSFAADTLTGSGFQGLRSICQLVAALFNIMLILWLIPAYSWKGAAWASIVTDLALAIAMWAFVLLLKKR